MIESNLNKGICRGYGMCYTYVRTHYRMKGWEVKRMNITRDEAFRAVCEFRTPIGNSQYSVGTGMFVNAPIGRGQYRGWIVTASHVALKTNRLTKIIFATENGRGIALPLTSFGPLETWRHHKIADVSAFPIKFTEENLPYMNNRFIPSDHINFSHVPVSRDYELTSIGFPHGLGINGSFSPFTFRSYASSGFVTLNRFDVNIPCEFFCLENPSVGGYSGCPVFALGYTMDGNERKIYNRSICHGIMHGTLCDDTGGKIAMVTPAFYMKDVLI